MEPNEASGPQDQSTARIVTPRPPALFLSAVEQVKATYENVDRTQWRGSPFEWMLTLPSRSKGAAAEKIVEAWARSEGITVAKPSSTDYDRTIAGQRVEIKMSTLWATGQFKFQQIRDQNYDACLCLGFEPQKVKAWLLPKHVLRRHVIGHTGQHTGLSASDTFWLEVTADNPPGWMAPYGDTLEHVAGLLRSG